jgi:hypothetical protein
VAFVFGYGGRVMSDGINGVYTSKIIRAGALLAETKTLLAYWDEALSIDENLNRAQQENIFGKASRSWINQFLRGFRERYLADGPTAQALVILVKNNLPTESLDRVLYFHAAQADLLLHDVVTEVLLPLRQQGRTEVFPADIQAAIRGWIDEGKTSGPWSENTIIRSTRNLMATLRDFRILQGAAKKRLAPVYLPVEAFAYIAKVLQREQPSGQRLLQHPEWELFSLSPQAVERLFVEAHQRRLLEYHAAGSVIRIGFPVESIQEYAHVILQRTP